MSILVPVQRRTYGLNLRKIKKRIQGDSFRITNDSDPQPLIRSEREIPKLINCSQFHYIHKTMNQITVQCHFQLIMWGLHHSLCLKASIATTPNDEKGDTSTRQFIIISRFHFKKERATPSILHPSIQLLTVILGENIIKYKLNNVTMKYGCNRFR